MTPDSYGKVVLGMLNGERLLGRLSITKKGTSLLSEVKGFPPVPMPADSEFVVLGVVISIIRKRY